MAEVVLSGAIRSNLLSIQNTARLLDDTQLRLSTGLKVNSAVDDPTAFFQARSLNTRAGDLNRLVDSLQQSINTIQTADEGITSLQKLVESAKALANRALETPIVASSSEGPRQVVTDPDVTATAFASGIASGDVLTVQVGGGSVRSVTVGSKTIGELVSAINAITGVSAEITNERSLKIEGDSGRALVIGSSAGSVANDLGLAGSFTNGTNRDKFETDYNELRLQIDQLAGDANYQGVNLLRGDDLTINFNESQTSQITIRGVDFTVDGDLRLPEITARSWENEVNLRNTVRDLDAASRTLRTQASTFGSNLGVVEIRQGFTDQLINTLEGGAADLTLADTNEEGANLLALQTRQQLGSVALSIASQSEQSVLQLF
ncbi:flagellin [Tepidicaulis sp.]|jgi:flagellin-like hook-associated protein FlgL|uniref:flagellin N-terminal helical domain-containing protein n=1 Tax=Tepidicaulis sp. TaxID=1920809 RepID=UPI003B5BA700